MRLLLAVAAAAVGGVLPPLGAGVDDVEEVACLARASAEIERAPDKDEMHVTTSRRFKWNLAEFFCHRSSPRQGVLEVGVFRGHTTAVLAGIFARVLAVDVEAEYLLQAAAHCEASPEDLNNVIFLSVDTFADDWHMMASNKIHVAFIDGDHRYEHVLVDTQKALLLLRPLDYLVFDDYGYESDVRQAIAELVEDGALADCQPLGLGSDGEPWLLQNWGWVNHSEGVVCRRGVGMPDATRAADFQDSAFLVYPKPLDFLARATSILSFQGDGNIWTSHWGAGTWQWPNWAATPPRDPMSNGAGAASATQALRPPPNRLLRDVLNVSLPGLQAGSLLEVLFNRPRTAFVLSEVHTSRVLWFGLRANRVNHVFIVANDQFVDPDPDASSALST